MSDEFGMLIRTCFLKAGLSGASEIFRAESPRSFGNTESVWRIGDLRLRFIKDRSQFFVDIGSTFDESLFYVFDDVALLMGWQNLEEIIEASEPLDLLSALKFIKQDFTELELMFSKQELQTTSIKLDDISKEKAFAKFG